MRGSHSGKPYLANVLKYSSLTFTVLYSFTVILKRFMFTSARLVNFFLNNSFLVLFKIYFGMRDDGVKLYKLRTYS